jgi:hypothetical protein
VKRGTPGVEVLLEAVTEWIDEIRPLLDDRNAFLARVARAALAVVGREIALGPAVSANGRRQLSKLLGHGGEYGELSNELSELLRRGQIDSDTPGLLEALTAVTVGQLAIDQPGYRYEGGTSQACAPPAPGADAP